MEGSNISNNEVKWLIKKEDGSIIGPYSTKEVLNLISRGVCGGEEEVAKYPGGSWINISREDKFYDKLLASLSEDLSLKEIKSFANSNKKDGNKSKSGDTGNSENIDNLHSKKEDPFVQSSNKNESHSEKKSDQLEERKKNIKSKAVIVENTDLKSKINKYNIGEKSKIISSESSSYSEDSEDLNEVQKSLELQKYNLPEKDHIKVIDLLEKKNAQKKIKKREKKRSYLSAFLIIAVGVLLIVLNQPKERNKERNFLLLPKNSTKKWSEKEVKNKLKGTIKYFFQHTFEGYMEAQKRFIEIVENSQALVPRGMLCMTYKEIWPYTKRNSQELQIISSFVHTTTTSDLLGLNGIYCKITKLLVMNRNNDANSLVDETLEKYTEEPFLYQIKAELLADERDYKNAIFYSRKAQKLWESWIKPQIFEAIMWEQLKKPKDAFNIYKNILDKIPNHSEVNIRLGLLYLNFSKLSESKSKIIKGLKNDKVYPILKADAFLGLAKIYLDERNAKKSLKFAQKSYALNSGNKASKELIIQLGGKLVKTKNQINEQIAIGDKYMATGDCFAAQAEYKAAFELNNKNALAAYKAAKCLWELKQRKDAINWLYKSIKADYKMVDSYVLLSKYYVELFDFFKAVQILGRAQKNSPRSFEIQLGYANVELARNNYKGAITFAQRAEKLSLSNVQVYIILAKAYLGMKEFDLATKNAVKAIEVDPTNKEAHIIYADIIAYLQGVDYAESYLNNLMSSFKHSEEYRLALSEIYIKNERFEQAKELLNTLLNINPRHTKALIYLGNIEQFYGNFDKAISYYFSAAVSDPSDPEPLFNAGMLHFKSTHQYKEAIVQFERVLKINKLYPRVNYYIGEAALKLSPPNPQRSLNEALQERELNPGMADSYILAGKAYSMMGKYTKCVEEYRNAIRLRPSGAETYVKMANCCIKSSLSNKFDIALSMLEEAKKQSSGYAPIYRELGTIYEIKGEYDGAIASYLKYLNLSVQIDDRSFIEQKIENLKRSF